jgi:hypothetical protein
MTIVVGTVQVCHVAYSADSVALFGDMYLRDDEQLHWKPGMLEFNFHLTEVPQTLQRRDLHQRDDVLCSDDRSKALLCPTELQMPNRHVGLSVPTLRGCMVCRSCIVWLMGSRWQRTGACFAARRRRSGAPTPALVGTPDPYPASP